jgi:hypothetical protein
VPAATVFLAPAFLDSQQAPWWDRLALAIQNLRQRPELPVDVDKVIPEDFRSPLRAAWRSPAWRIKPRIVGTHFDITNRKKAEEAEREQRAFAEALSDTSAVLNSTLDINKVLDLILTNVGRVVPHDDSDIWLTDPYQKIAAPIPRKPTCGKFVPRSLAELTEQEISFFQQMAKTRQPVLLADLPPDQAAEVLREVAAP